VSEGEASPSTLTHRRPASLRRARVRLELVAGPDAGKRHVFDGRARVGTRSVADFVLHDSKVSGLHFELHSEDLRLKDLGSKNGTFVGGLRVFDAMVSPGETIEVGTSRLRVVPLAETVEVPLSEVTSFHGLVGESAGMRALIAKLERLAGSDVTVLIQGETGTGKEVVAEALHLARSPSGPLEILDCGGVAPNLIESELFGHVRGAFSGAVASAPGAFERADTGTLFLDEIGELPLELQPKLLRALETRTVSRVGGGPPTPVSIRVVAATHRDLQLEVARGRFREDLFHRLAVVTVEVPPLRERLDDVPLLAAHLLRLAGVDPVSYLTADSVATLTSHDWPGNVRELRNTLDRAVALTRPIELSAAAAARRSGASAFAVDLDIPLREGRQRVVEQYERAYVRALLGATGGNVTEAARRAGMDRMSIHRMVQRLKLRKAEDDGD
jgi:DNA-binding NtrC family response regulator